MLHNAIQHIHVPQWRASHVIQYHPIPCNIIQCHTKCHAIPCNVMLCYMSSNIMHAISSSAMQCHLLSYNVIECHAMSWNTIQHHLFSCKVTHNVMSCYVMYDPTQCHPMSYNVIQCLSFPPPFFTFLLSDHFTLSFFFY